MGFFLFRAQVRLQACCFSHFPSNHLLMQLAITPATTERKNVMIVSTEPPPFCYQIGESNNIILSQQFII